MPDDSTACVTTRTEAMGAIHRADRPFPCRRRDQHYASCDNDKCRGCVPRSATHGFLCTVCYRRMQDALGRVGWLIAHLRSVEKPAQALGERVATSMERSILIPEPWLAADELMAALGARVIPSTASIDDAIRMAHGAVADWRTTLDARVNTVDGATQAVVLIKRMGTALRRWPDSEADLRHIPYVQCPSCHQTHLWRRAPAFKGDDIRVECGTENCGYTVNWWAWSAQYAPIFEELEKDMKRRERAAQKAMGPS